MKRFNVLNLHRRFGKTILCINHLIDKAFRCTRKNPQYAYIAPTYGSAKRVAWEYFKEYTKAFEDFRTIHEGDLKITLHRKDKGDKITIFLLGAENPDSVRGMYLDGVILDEYADMNPIIWSQVVRPALSDREGWAIFIGTPKGQNHFYDLYTMASDDNMDDWYARTINAEESGVIPEKELRSARKTMTEDEYAQEYMCSFTAALVGAYYSKYILDLEEKGQITSVPYDPHVAVSTYWDLGIDDSTVVWFCQQVGKEIHIIDYIEEAGKGLEFYVKEINNKPYIYSGHVLPHDGGARELGTGKSRQETLVNLGLKNVTVLGRSKVEDGINEVRLLLPRCWFDKIKCKQGLKALKNYQKKYDQKMKAYLQKPLHDWSSHAADGFRTLAMGLVDDTPIAERIANLPKTADDDYNVFNM